MVNRTRRDSRTRRHSKTRRYSKRGGGKTPTGTKHDIGMYGPVSTIKRSPIPVPKNTNPKDIPYLYGGPVFPTTTPKKRSHRRSHTMRRK